MSWVGGASAYHQYHPVSDPPVEYLEDILRNGQTFAKRWDGGRWEDGWRHSRDLVWWCSIPRSADGAAAEASVPANNLGGPAAAFEIASPDPESYGLKTTFTAPSVFC